MEGKIERKNKIESKIANLEIDRKLDRKDRQLDRNYN